MQALVQFEVKMICPGFLAPIKEAILPRAVSRAVAAALPGDDGEEGWPFEAIELLNDIYDSSAF